MCTDFRVVYRAGVDVSCSCYWSSPAAAAGVRGICCEALAQTRSKQITGRRNVIGAVSMTPAASQQRIQSCTIIRRAEARP